MNRNDTYRAMQLIRKHMNCEGSDRHELGLELERLRRSLGGMYFVEMPEEMEHKPLFGYQRRKIVVERV